MLEILRRDEETSSSGRHGDVSHRHLTHFDDLTSYASTWNYRISRQLRNCPATPQHDDILHNYIPRTTNAILGELHYLITSLMKPLLVINLTNEAIISY